MHWISGELIVNKAMPCNLPHIIVKISWDFTLLSPNDLKTTKDSSDTNFKVMPYLHHIATYRKFTGLTHKEAFKQCLV